MRRVTDEVAPGAPRQRARAAGEAAVVGLGASALAGGVGALVHPVVALGLGIVAGLNGLISGWRGIYAWRRADGWLAAALDSTWATVPVALGLLAHLGAAFGGDAGYASALSSRRNRHVYRRGVTLKRGFAFTIGNVVSGAGEVDGNARRTRLITDHEDVHVWQSRWFGPTYPLLYGLWAAGAAAVGLLVWLRRGRREPIARVIESCSYYTNPFEWWAYSRDDHWPPHGKLAGIGWRSPAARPLATVARHVRRTDDGARH
ncbi:MAG: hypothetical protein U0Q03_20605 [Acidimicrobiales bacterium]